MNASAITTKIPRTAWWLPLAVAVALVVTAFFAQFFLERGLTWPCPSLTLFSMPCPGCGGTRAFAALAEGDLLQALRFNPLLIFALPAALTLPWLKLEGDRWSRLGWPLLALLVAGNWIYLVLFLPR